MTKNRRPGRPSGNRPLQIGVGHPRRRSRFLLIGTFFVFSLIAAQLFRIQGIDAATMSTEALDSRLRVDTIPALRGDIVDDNGVVLASSVERFNVTADATVTVLYQKKVNGKLTTVGLPGAATDIAQAAGGNAADVLTALQKAYAKKSRFTYALRNVTPAQWKAIKDLGIPGIYSERTTAREYPQGTTVAPLVGWVNSNGVGSGGLEQMEQSTLNGTAGKHVYEVARDGSVIATGDNQDTPAKQGLPVKLTLDNDLQWYAQNTIADAVKKSKSLSGDVVVMDVQGNLKAVASYPSFDNNDMAGAPSYLQSRPFDEVYEPGSTSKVITLSALLSEGLANPMSNITVPSGVSRAGKTFHDSEPHGTEYLTLAGVLAKSSNIGTILAGEKLPVATLASYMSKFGLGQTSGIGMPGESAGLLPPYAKWNGTQRYTVLFGQGLSSTAIQQASVFQTIANGGVREPVKLIAGIGDGRGGWTAPKDTRTATDVVSKTVADEMTKMMEGVVAKTGTAAPAAVPGYNVAGKTGTADRYDSTLGRYNGQTASFIGFAPAQDPKYIVAVTLQKPTVGSIYGGEVAAPIFSQIMQYALQHGHVPPSTTKTQPYAITFTPSSPTKK